MKLVVVESPAKAKTIRKYLGKDYRVLASYGHIRDLPPKDGSVRPDQDFAMSWQVDGRSEQRMNEIVKAVKTSDHLYLATDPDREGEAISWHIVEELNRRKALKDIDVERVVFNEVTKNAVVDAFQQPRDLNQELIEAYLARRALDYLVGFTLSPVLWRKLPGSRSAGRVQSVALRLICEREAEIEVFRPQEFWTIDVALTTPAGAPFTARLAQLDGKKLEKFDLGDTATATAAAERLERAERFTVRSVERKKANRNPYPPFNTSSLQQEASRKLGFGATHTMRVAQGLYEGVDLGGEQVGLITYMRTDAVQVSAEAIPETRHTIIDRFGKEYLPPTPRLYRTKAKNAQEAHEAIRPTDLSRHPSDVARHLTPDALKLYELIWKRMVASQMASAEFDQVAVDIDVDDGTAGLRANGSIMSFDGFLRLYQEGRDDQEGDRDGDRRLPKMSEGERHTRDKVLPEQHFTKPPPRYGEASLVKRMEELGIGRPSTYASILQVLQDRDYVRLDKRRFVPQDRGRIVIAFLSSFFQRYVQYNFTADLEKQLDDISGGRVDWKTVLRDFWAAFSEAVAGTKDLSITAVIDALDEALGPHFFPLDPENPDKDPRACPACGDGRLGLRLGRSGGFIGCSNYPDCGYTRQLALLNGEEGAEAEFAGPRQLGEDPETGKAVTLRKGPFGIYVQLGEPEGKAKPKRSSLPKGMTPDEVSLEKALALLALPREVGRHPESGEAITAGLGRYGPYVKHQSTYRSLSEGDDVLSIGLNRAVALIAEAPARRGSASRQLGEHPDDGKVVSQGKGRFGPYVKHGKVYASLPKDMDPDSVTLDQAVELLAAKAEKQGSKPAAKKSRTKPAAKKKAPAKKKPAAKKKPPTTKATR
jgi:DNA topoisomerase-1